MNKDNKTQDNSNTVFFSNVINNILVITVFFIFLVISLMLINYISLKNSDPLNSKQLKKLITKSIKDPNNKELRKQIRAFDLLARKAFFSSTQFMKYGTYLLIFGITVFVIFLKINANIKKKIITKDELNENMEIDSIFESKRKVVFISGIVILSIAISISFYYKADNQIESLINNISKDKINIKNMDSYKIPSIDEIKKNWAYFRGTFSSGISEKQNPLTNWNIKTGKNILWKVKIPNEGFNSPVIWNDKLFLTGGNKKKREIFCFDANKGNLLWKREVNDIKTGMKLPRVASDTGFAAPTVAVDGNHVFAIFATGYICAYDFSGKKIWDRHLGIPENHYGHSSSLIFHKNILIVQYDHGGGCKVFAFDTKTGNLVWEKRRDLQMSWASPILIENNDKIQVVLSAAPNVIAYDIFSGEIQWKVKCMDGEVGSSPAFSDGLLFAANEYAKLAAIDIKTEKIIWENNEDLPDASSLLAFKDYLIVPTSSGIVTCYRAKTGKILWKKEFKEGFYSSPILVNNSVYLIDKNGVMRVFKLSDKYEEIASIELLENSVATPAFYKNRIYIRGYKHLFCIGNR